MQENRRAFPIAELIGGAWFGGVRDPRVVIGVVAFQAVSLGWLGLAARAGAKPQTAAAAA